MFQLIDRYEIHTHFQGVLLYLKIWLNSMTQCKTECDLPWHEIALFKLFRQVHKLVKVGGNGSGICGGIWLMINVIFRLCYRLFSLAIYWHNKIDFKISSKKNCITLRKSFYHRRFIISPVQNLEHLLALGTLSGWTENKVGFTCGCCMVI